MAAMIRKQLYLTDAQNKVLKQRARELGISEAELARQALDQMLQPSEQGTAPHAETESARQEALSELLRHTRRLAEGRRLPAAFKTAYQTRGRDVLYESRLDR
ncbi:hypothetical protein [Longimonas halophila]|nr:hypothetical protein [Longimonas halophila]